jgi:hypothetical protein
LVLRFCSRYWGCREMMSKCGTSSETVRAKRHLQAWTKQHFSVIQKQTEH